MTRFRAIGWPRPSAAMVVAITSLVTATSGDAIAGALNGVVGKDQVTSRSVKDNSLTLNDFGQSARVKLKGSRGVIGAKGETGAHALARISRRSALADDLVSPPAPGCPPAAFCPRPIYATGTARCPEGHLALGGGVDPGDDQYAEVVATYPTADGLGWTGTSVTPDVNRKPHVTVSVLCAPTRPK